MAKLTLNDVNSGFQSHTAVNTNNTLIETALENTLSRDGTTPNEMLVDFDLNSNDLLNGKTLYATGLVLNGTSILPVGITSAPASGISFTPIGNISSITVQEAITEEMTDLASSSGATLVGTASSTYNSGITVQEQLTNIGSSTGTSNIGFTQGGTGAVARTQQSKNEDYVSVFDFMTPAQIVDVQTYTSSIDVTAALNNAFSTVGRIIYCPAGGYRISSNLAPPTCAGIVGDGWQPGAHYRGTRFICYSTIGLELRGTNCLLLRDLALQGNAAVVANSIGILIGNGTSTVSSTFTGEISETTLTVSGISGTIEVGHTIDSTGGLIVVQGTTIIAQLTGTPGGNGTYTVNKRQSITSLAMFSNGLYTWDYGKIQNVRIFNFAGTGSIGMHLRNANFASIDGLHIDNCTQFLKTSTASSAAGTVPADCWFKDLSCSSSSAEGLVFGGGAALKFINPRISGTGKEAMILDPSLGDGVHPVEVTMTNLQMENIYSGDNSFYHIKVNSLSTGSVYCTLLLDSTSFEVDSPSISSPKFLYTTGSNSKVFLEKTLKDNTSPNPSDTSWLVADSGAKILINSWYPDTQVMTNASCTGGTLGTIEGDNVETVFTPTFTNLTQTGGAATLTGYYTKKGKVVTWKVKIVPVTSTTSAAGGSTYFTGLPGNITTGAYHMSAVTTGFAATPFPNNGLLGSSGGAIVGYCPQWTTLTTQVTLSGTYIIEN